MALLPSPPSPQLVHILVVDDDAPIRLLLGTFLKKMGYRVTVAADGTEALTLFDANVDETAIDIVLLDMKMPGMHGIEVCQLLRQRSDVPILFLSGLDEDGELLAKVGLQNAHFIQKPFSVREVEAKVMAMLQE